MYIYCLLRQKIDNTEIFDPSVYSMIDMFWLCSFNEINVDILFVATPFGKIYEEQIR